MRIIIADMPLACSFGKTKGLLMQIIGHHSDGKHRSRYVKPFPFLFNPIIPGFSYAQYSKKYT